MDKVEKFLFDIFGLIIPGLVCLLLLVTMPFVFVDLSAAKLLPLKSLTDHIFSKNLSAYYIILYGVIFVFISYLIGHAIKVLSKYQYRLFSIIFDDGINVCVAKLSDRIGKRISVVPILKQLCSFFRKFLKDIFCFKRLYEKSVQNAGTLILTFMLNGWNPDSYVGGNPFHTTSKTSSYPAGSEDIRLEVLKRLKAKYKIDIPDNWYAIYKFCKIVEEQERLKSLSYSFLAKYIAYRSLAFVFLLVFLYMIFFISCSDMISSMGQELLFPVLGVILLFWLTFHERYKYYYPLCGNETLMALYYFLLKSEAWPSVVTVNRRSLDPMTILSNSGILSLDSAFTPSKGTRILSEVWPSAGMANRQSLARTTTPLDSGIWNSVNVSKPWKATLVLSEVWPSAGMANRQFLARTTARSGCGILSPANVFKL